MQLYAGLRVLTAAPSLEDQARVPHHLYGVADAAQAWSVGRWLRVATRVLSEIEGRGRSAVVVGGTGLYFRALTQGLAQTPDIPPEARSAADDLWRRDGEAGVRAALKAGDPEGEARIERGDRQRLVRALSVLTATGHPLGAWQADTSPLLPLGAWRGVVVEPERAALYARCDARLQTMLAEGALEEVRALTARDLDPALPAMKALGVREFAAHLRGELSLQGALASVQQATRNYAKRQLTWFRNQTPDWRRVEAVDAETVRQLLLG